MKWVLIILFGALLSGIQARAINLPNNNTMTPSAVSDLRSVVAFANKIERQHKGQTDIFLLGLKEVRRRCQRAGRAANRLIAFKMNLDRQLAQSAQSGTLRVVYTPPVPALHYAQDRALTQALQLSINRKIASLSKALPNQAFVTELLNAKAKHLQRNSPLAQIVKEATELKLRDPNHLVGNAQIYLRSLNESIDGTSSGYAACIAIVNSIDVEGK